MSEFNTSFRVKTVPAFTPQSLAVLHEFFERDSEGRYLLTLSITDTSEQG